MVRGLKPKKKDLTSQISSGSDALTTGNGVTEGEADSTHPTDMSDTTDSEEKVPRKCTVPHSGKQQIQNQFAMNIDHMFTLLFVNSQITLDLLASKGIKDYEQTPWQPESGERTRTVTYVLATPSGAIGPKDVRVIETQTMHACSKPGALYSIDTSSRQEGIPYQDNFTIDRHICLQRVSDHLTRMTLHTNISFKKNPWGVVKAFIERGTSSEIEDNARQIEARLFAEAEAAPGAKARRRRRSQAQCLEAPPLSIPSLPRPSISAPRAAPRSSGSWVEVALVLLLLMNGLLCLKLFFPGHVEDFVSRLHQIGEPSRTDIGDWSTLLEQYIRRQRGKQLEWRDTLDITVTQLYRAEQALRKLIDSIEPLPQLDNEVEADNDSYNTLVHDVRNVQHERYNGDITDDAENVHDIYNRDIREEDDAQTHKEDKNRKAEIYDEHKGHDRHSMKAVNNARETGNMHNAYEHETPNMRVAQNMQEGINMHDTHSIYVSNNDAHSKRQEKNMGDAKNIQEKDNVYTQSEDSNKKYDAHADENNIRRNINHNGHKPSDSRPIKGDYLKDKTRYGGNTQPPPVVNRKSRTENEL